MPTSVHVIADPERAASALNPLRLRILRELAAPDSAAGLARRISGVSRQQINYHVRQLEEDGLLELVEERRVRNCTERVLRPVARSYVISPEALGVLAADPERVTDRASSAYLVAVASRTLREVATLREGAEAAGKRLPTLTLDTRVRFGSVAAQRAFAEELSEAVARMVEKYHDEASPDGRAFRLVAGAYPQPSAVAGGVPESEGA